MNCGIIMLQRSLKNKTRRDSKMKFRNAVEIRFLTTF